MKKNILLIVTLGALAAIGQPQTLIIHDTFTARKHEAVVLWASQSGYGSSDSRGYTYVYNGAQIYVSSSSDGAPTFPQATVPLRTNNLVELGEGIATLLNAGFRLAEKIDGGGYLFVKP